MIKKLFKKFLRLKNRKITLLNNFDYLNPLDNESIDKNFKLILREAYSKLRPLVSKENIGSPHDLSIYTSIEYLNLNKISGDIVEIGVDDGMKIYQAIKYNQNFKNFERNFYLYDTFSGMTKPSKNDYSFHNQDKKHNLKKYKKLRNTNFVDWNYTSYEKVKFNMKQTGYDMKKINLIKGDVLNTIPNQFHKKIALLRIDVDWELPHYHSLKYLYNKVVKNGIIIFDDYGSYYGAKKSIDKFFSEKKIKPLLISTSPKEKILLKT